MQWETGFAAVLLLVGLLASSASAQNPSSREALLEEAVALLREEIRAKNQRIASLELDIADMQAKTVLLEEIQRQKDIQISLHESNNELLADTVDSQKEWIAELEESISGRDTVIQELARDVRPSVWVRLVESIPAVAAILAGVAR